MSEPFDQLYDEDQLAQELRDAFGLGPDASGFEVDLAAPRAGGSSAPFTGSARSRRHERGTLLGDFEILEELGRGGMGVVYRARQVSLGREVALKVLPDYAHRGPLAIQRFRNEARAAARLQHTNIVPIYAQGEDRDTFFYAMELIEGASLDAAIRERTRVLCPSNVALSAGPSRITRQSSDAPTLPVDSRAGASPASAGVNLLADARQLHRTVSDYRHLARLLAEVADGLDHAHRAGVIHRDIKPQNLLVGKDARLHITDFGLARLADAPTLTLSGEIMGTPAYLSPEQARADQSAVDGRTDIYSLGVTLYELLTLKRPFEGESREQILSGIKELEPQPPRDLDEHIPRDLQTICLKAMEKDPARRYPTAAALAEDLRRFAEGRPILSRPAGPLTKAIKWSRRHKAATTAIVSTGVVLLLAGGLAASLIKSRHREAEALIAEVWNRLVYYDYHATPEQLACLDRAQELGGNLADIRVLRALDMLFDRDDQSRKQAARDELANITADYPDNTDARYLYAVALDRTGDPAASVREIQAADASAATSAAGWFFRGLARHFRDPQEAVRSYEKACDLRSAEGDVYLQATLHLARARSQSMYVTRTIDDLGAIVRPLEQIVDFGLYGAYPHNLLSIAHRLAAEVYTGSAGARDSARLVADHYALALHWAQLGQQADPEDPLCFLAEGMARQGMGDFPAAIAAFTAARNAAGHVRDRECEALHYRWRLHYWLGELEEALADVTAAATGPDACAGQELPLYAHFYPMLILAEQGKQDAARAHAYALSADAPTNALALVWTATALRILGDEAAARRHLEQNAPAADAVAEIPQHTREWILGLLDMCRGLRPLADQLALARDADQPWRLTGEAEFHAAAMALAAGDRPAALAGFLRAWRTYDSATRYTYHAELIARKLEQAPDWPPWVGP